MPPKPNDPVDTAAARLAQKNTEHHHTTPPGLKDHKPRTAHDAHRAEKKAADAVHAGRETHRAHAPPGGPPPPAEEKEGEEGKGATPAEMAGARAGSGAAPAGGQKAMGGAGGG